MFEQFFRGRPPSLDDYCTLYIHMPFLCLASLEFEKLDSVCTPSTSFPNPSKILIALVVAHRERERERAGGLISDSGSSVIVV